MIEQPAAEVTVVDLHGAIRSALAEVFLKPLWTLARAGLKVKHLFDGCMCGELSAIYPTRHVNLASPQ